MTRGETIKKMYHELIADGVSVGVVMKMSEADLLTADYYKHQCNKDFYIDYLYRLGAWA